MPETSSGGTDHDVRIGAQRRHLRGGLQLRAGVAAQPSTTVGRTFGWCPARALRRAPRPRCSEDAPPALFGGRRGLTIRARFHPHLRMAPLPHRSDGPSPAPSDGAARNTPAHRTRGSALHSYSRLHDHTVVFFAPAAAPPGLRRVPAATRGRTAGGDAPRHPSRVRVRRSARPPPRPSREPDRRRGRGDDHADAGPGRASRGRLRGAPLGPRDRRCARRSRHRGPAGGPRLDTAIRAEIGGGVPSSAGAGRTPEGDDGHGAADSHGADDGHGGGDAGRDEPSTPTLAILSEYDSLPGIGHGCGHNVIAVMGLGAFLALAQLAEEDPSAVPGKVVFLGTPAEEGHTGKEYMAREGAFDGLDAVVMAHPYGYDLADQVWLGRRTLTVEYHGATAHASAQPYMGRNALDAASLMYQGIGLMRQQTPPSDRIHAVIREGGE